METRTMLAWIAVVVLLACLAPPAGAQVTSRGTTSRRSAGACTTGDSTSAYARCRNDHYGEKTLPRFPTVKPYAPEHPPLFDVTYPQPIPMDTDIPYEDISLLDIPGALVSDRWTKSTDIGLLEVRRVFSDPLILTMEKFLLPNECRELIGYGKRNGFQRSLTTTGVHEIRTSDSSYIPAGHRWARLLTTRAAAIVNCRPDEIELGPILRYAPGQHFDTHHDAGSKTTYGRRMTFFIPLSATDGETGGHTAFPYVSNFRFPPKAGTAILWRNHAVGAPDEVVDQRMRHKGEKPVLGEKFAVNMWIYPRNYLQWQELNKVNTTLLEEEKNRTLVVDARGSSSSSAPLSSSFTPVKKADKTWRGVEPRVKEEL